MEIALLWGLAIILVVIGIVGIVLPGVPGTILIFAGFVLAAWIDGFTKVGWGILSVLGVLTLLSFLIDFAATALGSKRAGASREAIIGAALGTFVGIFFGFVGLIVGPFLGAAAGEIYARRDIQQAGRVGFATWVGMAVGIITKIALAFIMLGIFIFAYFI